MVLLRSRKKGSLEPQMWPCFAYVPVCFLRAIFVPEDETCFFLYEEVSTDAALPFERIIEAAEGVR
jgi:hypothetical protein